MRCDWCRNDAPGFWFRLLWNGKKNSFVAIISELQLRKNLISFSSNSWKTKQTVYLENIKRVIRFAIPYDTCRNVYNKSIKISGILSRVVCVFFSNSFFLSGNVVWHNFVGIEHFPYFPQIGANKNKKEGRNELCQWNHNICI